MLRLKAATRLTTSLKGADTCTLASHAHKHHCPWPLNVFGIFFFWIFLLNFFGIFWNFLEFFGIFWDEL